MPLKLNEKHLSKFISADEFEAIKPQIESAHRLLHDKTGPGNSFLGWLDLPKAYDKEEFLRIKKAAEKIRSDSDILIVIGIGGSYLGARAAIEFLYSQQFNDLACKKTKIYFAGNSISPRYLNEILEICKDKDVSINVISKSGTTTEPALAFRVFREFMENKYGEAAKDRIYCTTDKSKGTLKTLSDRNGYQTFVIPDDVGGRFSVLTAVGLLPIAVAGADIDALMEGAAKAMDDFSNEDVLKNSAYRYAAIRNILYRKGKSVELLASYEPSFALMNEWFKQLFGESEGKDQKGLFPASVIYSTDLHSLGQFVQDGSRLMFETVVNIKNAGNDLFLKDDEANSDGLNFLSNQNMSLVNRKALEGTILAHTEGGVPNLIIELDSMTEFDLGYLIYFFEKACAISGYILSVNPFNQPGVEDYKKNMFALLGKPGYEAEKETLEKLLK